MDPATAIGVASASISFLDFAIEVCKAFSQIAWSSDGATKENAQIKATAEKLRDLTECINVHSGQLTSSRLSRNLDSAVHDSIASSKKLLALLERVQPKPTDDKVFGPLKAVYKSMRYRPEVQRLQRDAESCRLLVVQALVQDTRYTNDLAYQNAKAKFSSLDKQSVAILEALREGKRRDIELLDHISGFRQSFDAIVLNFEDASQAGHDQIERRIDSLAQEVLDMNKPNMKKAFADSIFFQAFEARKENVSAPNAKTFDWIFDREGTTSRQKATWPSFPKWLESPESTQQYWLSGKAGSGKSTLMANVIREDLKGAQTRMHLGRWSGSKPLHVLSFFLYRAGGALQSGLEHLLKSLIWQLIKAVPQAQDILLAHFLPHAEDDRIPMWPVQKLKEMLKLGLDIADDCAFLICVDGVDEFQDHANPNECSTTASDLVDFLCDIQNRPHVKLFLASRPELHISRRHPSFREAKLADLNREDIRIFVEARIKALAGLEFQKDIIQEVCRRADGVFMWAVFAVQEIKEGHEFEEGYPELVNRLDAMGEGLNTAISHMVRGIKKSHRRAVAFYLQAMGSWRGAGMEKPIDIALIAAASPFRAEPKSVEEFLSRCIEEERNVRNFSRGLMEIEDDLDEVLLTDLEARLVITPPNIESCGNVDPRGKPKTSESEDSWNVTIHEKQLYELSKYCHRGIILIHRSAYDFFFGTPDGSHEYSAELRALMASNDEKMVSRVLQKGLYALLWIEPILLEQDRRTDVYKTLCNRLSDIVVYTAGASFSMPDCIEYLDGLLPTAKLDFLYRWFGGLGNMVRENIVLPWYPRRSHGDLFPSFNADELLELQSNDQCMSYIDGISILEANFWLQCAEIECLHTYFSDHVADLSQSSSGRSTLSVLLTHFTSRRYHEEMYPLRDRTEAALLKAIEGCSDKILPRAQSNDAGSPNHKHATGDS